jgi:hypothetical protein
MLLKLFHKIEREEVPSNLFFEANIALMQKPEKGTHINCRPISLINVVKKLPNKILVGEFNKVLKGSYTMIKLVSFQECKNGSRHANQ